MPPYYLIFFLGKLGSSMLSVVKLCLSGLTENIECFQCFLLPLLLFSCHFSGPIFLDPVTGVWAWVLSQPLTQPLAHSSSLAAWQKPLSLLRSAAAVVQLREEQCCGRQGVAFWEDTEYLQDHVHQFVRWNED